MRLEKVVPEHYLRAPDDPHHDVNVMPAPGASEAQSSPRRHDLDPAAGQAVFCASEKAPVAAMIEELTPQSAKSLWNLIQECNV